MRHIYQGFDEALVYNHPQLLHNEFLVFDKNNIFVPASSVRYALSINLGVIGSVKCYNQHFTLLSAYTVDSSNFLKSPKNGLWTVLTTSENALANLVKGVDGKDLITSITWIVLSSTKVDVIPNRSPSRDTSAKIMISDLLFFCTVVTCLPSIRW